MVTSLSFDTIFSSRADPRTHFSTDQCDALFSAVLDNDRIDGAVRLPDHIHLDYRQEHLIRCFRICHQVWSDGVDRALFQSLMAKLRATGSLNHHDQVLFKNIRAKFKQLRFAHANFDDRHRYPRAFHYVTAMMGHLQDDFRNDRHDDVRRRAKMLRLLLTSAPYGFIRREASHFRPTTTAGFRNYMTDQIGSVQLCVEKKKITGKEFHDIRKVVSRQASFYAGLTALYPSSYHSSVFRYLSAINGLMGNVHDDLIRDKISSVEGYRRNAFTLPNEIAERLAALVRAHLT